MQRERINRDILDAVFDELFPICRSITGPGFRDSLSILSRFIPLKLESVASGTEVFDWRVPPEWSIRDAYLIGPDGNRVVDFKDSNLHLVNYSEPVDREMSLEELQPHLHSLERLPTAIPYVTSYYKRNWGFCMSHEHRLSLKSGRYRAVIDSELNPDGELNYAQCVMQGETDKEILLSSYLCHPSLANNELSGPLVLLGLFDRLSRWERRRYTYRFLINPETIGSLCFLHRWGEQLKSRLFGGLVLNCLGGSNDSLSYKFSRQENSPFNRLVTCLNRQENIGFKMRNFEPTGSDERQFCSAGFNLPIGQFARDVYRQHDEYHNSLDTKEYMGIDQVEKSIDMIELFLKRAEIAGRFQNLLPYGEPQLGRRGLYPTMNTEATRNSGNDEGTLSREWINRLRYVLAYSDGEHDMMQIAEKLDCHLGTLEPIIEKLEQTRLLSL